MNCDAYRFAKSKDEKTNISRNIIKSLRNADPPSRFLQKAGTIKDEEERTTTDNHNNNGIENNDHYDDGDQDTKIDTDEKETIVWEDIGDRRAILKTSQLLREMVAKGNHKTIYQKRKYDKEHKKLDKNCENRSQSLSSQLSSPPSMNASMSNVSPSSNRLNDQYSFMRPQQHQHASGLMNVVPPHSSTSATSTQKALFTPSSSLNIDPSLVRQENQTKTLNPALLRQENQTTTLNPALLRCQTNDLNTPVAYMQASAAASPSANQVLLHQQIIPNEMLIRNQLMMRNLENANLPLPTTNMQNPYSSSMMNTPMLLDSSSLLNRGSTTYMPNGITAAPSPYPQTFFCNVNNQFNNVVSAFNSVSAVPEASPTLTGTFFQDNAGNIRKIVGVTRNQIVHYQ